MSKKVKERGKYNTIWTIRKFNSAEDVVNDKPFEIVEFRKNLLLNEGINTFITLMCSSSGTKFDNANAYLGVGDSSAVEDPSQTGLQATTNKLYKSMDTGYPTYGTLQKAVWKATFGPSDANFDWNEFTVANGNSDSAMNLNRKVSAQGSKVSGQTWELALTITWS